MAGINTEGHRVKDLLNGRTESLSSPYSPFSGTDSGGGSIFPTIVSFTVIVAIVVAMVKFRKPVQEFFKKQFNIDIFSMPSGSKKPTTPSTSSDNTPKTSTTVTVNSEKMSVSVFLLCLFLPFLAPIFALFQGRILLFLMILCLWGITFFVALIPVIWWLFAIMVVLGIAIVVSKTKDKTEVVVSH